MSQTDDAKGAGVPELQQRLSGLLVWLGVTLAVMLVSYVTPVPELAVKTLRYRPVFALGIASPAIGFLVYAFSRWVTREPDGSAQVPRAGTTLSLLMLYCLFLILMTGGIRTSPLVPFCGVVPIIASKICDSSTKMRLLIWYLFGIVVLGIVSVTDLFAPPATYPKEGLWVLGDALVWHRIEVAAAATVLVLAILIEYGFSKLASESTLSEGSSGLRLSS